MAGSHCGSENRCHHIVLVATIMIYEKRRAVTERPCHIQKVFLCIALGPPSSYSRLEIHMRLNVSSDASIEPPIQVEYILSWGADI